jgi:hypothetical protein
MKKIILITLAFVLTAITSIGQESNINKGDKLHFGLKIGGNISNIYDSKGEEFKADPKIGLAVGVFASIPLGQFLGVHPELLFSQKGFKATGTLLGIAYNFARTTNYIDIPLLVEIKPIQQLTILVGPQYSYLMKQHDTFDAGSLSIEQETEFKNDNIRKNIFCITGGFDFNLNNFILGTRAGWDITNNNGDGTSTNPRYKNVWYQATVGLRF